MRGLNWLLVPAVAMGYGCTTCPDCDPPFPNVGGVCNGATVYEVRSGMYDVSTTAVQQDTCNTPPLSIGSMSKQRVDNDGKGNLFVYSPSIPSEQLVATGMVSCNRGNLTDSRTANANGCNFGQTTTFDLTVTAANRLRANVNVSRMGFSQASGTTICNAPIGGSCTINYTVLMQGGL